MTLVWRSLLAALRQTACTLRGRLWRLPLALSSGDVADGVSSTAASSEPEGPASPAQPPSKACQRLIEAAIRQEATAPALAHFYGPDGAPRGQQRMTVVAPTEPDLFDERFTDFASCGGPPFIPLPEPDPQEAFERQQGATAIPREGDILMACYFPGVPYRQARLRHGILTIEADGQPTRHVPLF